MSTYNIETTTPEDRGSNNKGKEEESQLKLHMGRVKAVITDNSALSGAIDFVLIERGNKTQSTESKLNPNGGGSIALPLDPNFRTLPLKNEIVILIINKVIIEGNEPQTNYFYLSTLNLFNAGVYNPDGEEIDLVEDDNLDLGVGIIETNLDKLRKLLLVPGDTSLEGRFGNTIRLGNSNRKFNTPWIQNGDENSPHTNSPIIIIRNGQKSVDKLNPIFENINEDNSSIYLTKGQIIPINVVSENMQTFKLEEQPSLSQTPPPLAMKGEDITNADANPAVEAGAKIENPNTKKLHPTIDVIDNGENSTSPEEETSSTPPDQKSDQVFTPINSDKYITIQPTSDPIVTDPPPPPPPTIPENADVYFLENGFYVYFEKGRHKIGAIVMDGSSTVYIGVPSFEKTRKGLAEEAASEVGSPVYGIEDPNPNSESTSNPGNSNSPDDPIRLDDFIYYYDDGAYIQKEILYKIYKDSNEYYAIGPDYPNNPSDYYTGGSVISNDDNSGIASVINSIEAFWAF